MTCILKWFVEKESLVVIKPKSWFMGVGRGGGYFAVVEKDAIKNAMYNPKDWEIHKLDGKNKCC